MSVLDGSEPQCVRLRVWQGRVQTVPYPEVRDGERCTIDGHGEDRATLNWCAGRTATAVADESSSKHEFVDGLVAVDDVAPSRLLAGRQINDTAVQRMVTVARRPFAGELLETTAGSAKSARESGCCPGGGRLAR